MLTHLAIGCPNPCVMFDALCAGLGPLRAAFEGSWRCVKACFESGIGCQASGGSCRRSHEPQLASGTPTTTRGHVEIDAGPRRSRRSSKSTLLVRLSHRLGMGAAFERLPTERDGLAGRRARSTRVLLCPCKLSCLLQVLKARDRKIIRDSCMMSVADKTRFQTWVLAEFHIFAFVLP